MAQVKSFWALLCFWMLGPALADDICSGEPEPLYWIVKDADLGYGVALEVTQLLGVKWGGYKLGGVFAHVGLQPNVTGCKSPLAPVFVMFNYKTVSHLTTTELQEIWSSSTDGFVYQGVAYYTPTRENQCPGTKPVYRYYIGRNYYYTFDLALGDKWVEKYDARDDGIFAYHWPANYTSKIFDDNHPEPTFQEWEAILSHSNATRFF